MVALRVGVKFHAQVCRGLVMLAAAAFFGGPATSAAQGQGVSMDRTVPPINYYNAFNLLYDGDYDAALKAFEADSRSSIKTAQSRWIDSICYETMCGECLFRKGMLREALPHYTAALSIFKTFSDWMVHVQFSPTIRPAAAGARKNVPWGMSKRPSPLGTYSRVEKLFQGQIDQSEVVQRGGVVQQANLFPVTPQEIVRATTLAMRRRATLLGPASKYDSLTNDLIAALNRPAGPPNHWSQSWVNLELGLALVAGGKEGQAIGHLQRAVLAGGEFDHPMTSIALLELGQQALVRGDYSAASQSFEEATYAAVNYPDFGVLEEAFRGGMLTHVLANYKGLFPLLEGGLQWTKTSKLSEFRTSLLLLAAENYAILGETGPAAAMLDEARATIRRRSMGAGWIGARLSYLSALVAYQQKRIPEGNKALTVAMNYMQRGGSRWLFHIGLADELCLRGGATPRMALDLFSEVLRDPQPADWATDPMESLAVLVTPHPLEIEHWFEAALDRGGSNAVQTAIEITERARRHRFFSSLEWGGRVESLRWLLEAAPEYLPQQALLQRQDLLARYPAYQQLSRQAQAIHAALAKMPLVAEDPTTLKEQTRQLKELRTIGLQQEAILREIAVRREPAGLIFPPLRTLPEVQKALLPKHAVLCFFGTEKQLHGFLLNNEQFAHWRIGSPSSVVKPIQAMLRDMGLFQPNHEYAVKDLADTKWKQSAQQALEMLLKGSSADFSQPFEELVIVPDRALWYLPFEALQVTVDKQPQPLVGRFRVRYAPTLSLTASQGFFRSPAGDTAVVVGKLYPRDDEKVARAAFEQLAAVVPGAVALRSPPPAPSSVYSTLFQRLIVLDDLLLSEQDPYGWSPAPIDRGKAGGSLGDWLALPWGGPDVIVLPGFHTAAEDALKREDSSKRTYRSLPGNDVFLSVCGLMANGARTVLLSRWRTGGQTSFDLVREFAQELPHTTPADALQRAILLVMDSRLTLEAEPRIKHSATEETPKANHPFFWAAYMLVDCGTAPEKPESKPDEPVIKVKKPDQPAEKVKPPAPEKPEPKSDEPPIKVEKPDPPAENDVLHIL